MPSARLPKGLLVSLLSGATVLMAGGAAGRDRPIGVVRRALDRELELTRSRMDVSRGARVLEDERASLRYATAVLEHGGAESLRRLDAYRVSRGTRERQVRRRTRSLYKLARGGMVRLMFEDLDDEGTRRAEQAHRITRGRTLRWLVKHDLRELSVHRRAESRARSELLAATRELQSLSGLRTAAALQTAVLREAGRTLDPELGKAHEHRKRMVRRHGKGDRETRSLRELVDRERREARRARGDGSLHGRDVRSPTGGQVLGAFGDYHDPVLRLRLSRTGVELSARRAQQVRALVAGRVVFVGQLPGYDDVVVLDHGSGYVSLTARLMDLQVREDQEIEAGAVIGRVAPKTVDDGLGPTVYLELRHGDRPVDPTPLL